MVALANRGARGMNVVDAGVKVGIAHAAANTSLLQQWAGLGYSLYFPPGQYFINGNIAWNATNDVKLWGDAASIQMTVDMVRMFDFKSVNRLEIEGLTFHTLYYTLRSSLGGAAQTSPIYTELCKMVNIHHNNFEGFQCHAIRMDGGTDIQICNNNFRDGHWISGGTQQQADTACIKMWRAAAGQARAREVLIQGNNCNTLALVGISAQHAMRKAVVTGNNVIAKDQNDVPLEGYAQHAPKSGIELQYYADASFGYTGADDEDYDQFVISDNNVQGCRFTGIGGQSHVRAVAVHPGVRGVILGNTIKHCGTDTNTGITSNLMGGLNWIGYRDLIVKGNIITDIPNVGGAVTGVNSLLIQNLWPRVDGSGNTSSPTSCNIEGNIISNCDARGIYITDRTGDINVQGNTVQDINGNEFIRVVVPASTFRAGHVKVDNNKLASTKPVGQYGLRVEVGTTEPAECSVSGNTLNFRNASSTVPRVLMEIVPDRAVVKGNRITGFGANSIGMNLNSFSNARQRECLLDTNQVENCETGVTGNSGASRGPYLLNHTTFTNCTTDIGRPHILPGVWANGQAIAYAPSVPPAGGNWEIGDTIFHSAPATGQPLGWICAGSGAGAASIWVPMNDIGPPPTGSMWLGTSGATMSAVGDNAVPITVMDTTGINDRVTVTPGSALLRVTSPGRYKFDYAVNFESNLGFHPIYIELYKEGNPVGLQNRGFMRDTGENIQLTEAIYNDVTQAELDASAGDIDFVLRVKGTSTAVDLTFFNCSFSTSRQ